MSARLLYEAARLAGFDAAGGWPEELRDAQFIALLDADAPGPWGKMLLDAVLHGQIEVRKAGEWANCRQEDMTAFPSVRTWCGSSRISLYDALPVKLTGGSQLFACLPPLALTEIEFVEGLIRDGREVWGARITYLFSREAAARWLRSIGETPGPLVSAWLGEAAKVGADATARPGRPPGKARARLVEILEALEEFAEANGEHFDRWAMPGQVGKGADDEGSLHWLCANLHKCFWVSARAFEEHRAGLCRLQAYAKPSDFYRRAMPVIAQKLKPTGEQKDPPTKRRKA